MDAHASVGPHVAAHEPCAATTPEFDPVHGQSASRPGSEDGMSGPVTSDTDAGDRDEGRRPRLTLGLPVYNGERYLAASLDSLLAQTFQDFELIIADNASTDATPAISRAYAAADPRVRYLRHEHNMGASFNHNVVVQQARGEFFKWVSHDDLYAPELLERCVQALDDRPEIVAAHAWTAFIGGAGEVVQEAPYRLETADPRPERRFRSLLYTFGGDDIYAVVRTRVMRRVAPLDSFHLADRVWVADLVLQGPICTVPAYLFFRRDHPQRAERSSTSVRARCSQLDPRRSDPRRHPVVRLVGEYPLAFLRAIWRAPMSVTERVGCTGVLVLWIVRHLNPLRKLRLMQSPDPAVRALGARSWAGRAWGHSARGNPAVAGTRGSPAASDVEAG
jgi:glycosyltransferase involved in cell wall biosynthesis